MCGIIGIKKFLKSPIESDQLRVRKGLLQQQHRGPDHYDTQVANNCIFGHNRLAIIDPTERSNQPFFDSTEQYVLIFNGEIYNFQELKNDLLQKDVSFETSSDTEVLLSHLIHFGAEGIKKLNGCFAFAFYDIKNDDLILARDHIGINPLLFSMQEEELLFASELSAFRPLLEEWKINQKALNAYFQFTYVPAPDTMIEGVHKLLPGHYLRVKGKSADMVKYYDVKDIQPTNLTYDEAVEKVKTTLENAIMKRLTADVPVGTFLSGGLDSSIVSAVTADFKTSLNTFSIGFEGNQFFDESTYAKKVADHIHSNHTSINLGQDKIIASFQKVLDSFDEPFADSSAVAMYFLSQEARKQVKVCLSGDGADELFAGYNKHKAFVKSKQPSVLLKVATRTAKILPDGNRKGKWSNQMRQLKKFGTLLQLKWPESYWMLASFISNEAKRNLLQNPQPYTSHVKMGANNLNNFLLADQEFVLPNDMLKKVDLMSMRHSLEVRTPFLDKEVVDLANSLPEEYKLHKGVGKRILRDAFKGTLPDEIFTRSKKGFEIPLYDWLIASWDEIVDNKWFSEDFLTQQGLFNPSGAIQLQAAFNSQKNDESTVSMWAYIVFQNWYQRWTKK